MNLGHRYIARYLRALLRRGSYTPNNGGYATPRAQNAAVANYRPRRNPATHLPTQSADLRLGAARSGGVSDTELPNCRKLLRPVEVSPFPPTSGMRSA